MSCLSFVPFRSRKGLLIENAVELPQREDGDGTEHPETQQEPDLTSGKGGQRDRGLTRGITPVTIQEKTIQKAESMNCSA